MRPLRALRYLTAFRCVAGQCADTCCAGLRVPVDQATLDRLHTLMVVDGDPLEVRGRLAPGEPGAPPEEAAFIRMDVAGACPFLDGERHCGVQKRYGLAGLGDACAQFPRAIREWEAHTEVTGSLACPEALRLLLSTPDALAWTEVAPDFLPRQSWPGASSSSSEEAPTTLRQALAEPLRQALVRGLTQTSIPLGARWILAGELCLGLDGRWDHALPEGELLAELQERCAVHPDEARGARAQQLVASLELPVDKILALLAEVVTERLSLSHPSRLAALVARAGPPAEWIERFGEAQRNLEGPTALRIERNLALQAANGFLRNPVALEHDPGLALGTAMLGAALASVLLTLELVGKGASQEGVDAACVETLQILAKNVDPHPTLRARAQVLFSAPPDERLRRMLLLAMVFKRRTA